MKVIQKNWSLWFGGLILLVGIGIRLWGINFDLPYIYHPDEPKYITIAQQIFKSKDLNPHFFNYPSLFFYIQSAAYIPYYLAGKLLGIFHLRSDILSPVTIVMGATWSGMPSTVLMGRLISVLFGTATIGLTFQTGKQLTGRHFTGLLAALFLAISPTNVVNSRYITPDTYVTFFASAALLTSLLVYQQGKTWQYILGGLCVGLTISSKYNGGLVLLPLLLAHFFHHGWIGWKQRYLYIAVLFMGFGFLFTTPYALLDFHIFLRDMEFEANHYATGHLGMEGNTLAWYLTFMWNSNGLIYILALVEIIRGLVTRSKTTLIISIFPVIYFVFISSFIVRNDRTFLPLTPFLFVLAAAFLTQCFTLVARLSNKATRQAAYLAMIAIGIVCLIVPTNKSVTNALQITSPNSRESARQWIEKNIPAGAKVAVESYAPFVQPDKYQVQGSVKITDHNPDWYLKNGFEYLVFSKAMFGRFFADRVLYQAEVTQYENFFHRFKALKTFQDPSGEVLIYQIEKP